MRFRWQVVPAVLAAALIHGTTSFAQPACSVAERPSATAVRLLDPALAASFDEGLRHSPTLRALLAQIENRQPIVFIRPDAVTLRQRNLLGATSHTVVRAGDRRIVFVSIAPGRGVATIDTLAHELQHVVELLDSNATEPAAVAGYYRSIGYQVSRNTFETDKARETGARVLAEVLRCRRGAK